MDKLTIKQVRVGLGLTQHEMATKLGISRMSYLKKEKGLTEFYFKEIKKICELANVDINKVIV